MKEITNLIIREYRLNGIDFMGYRFNRYNASYHHLIVPRRLGGKESVENGVVLNGKSSHPYLHIVEGRDYEMFKAITEEMIKEKELGRLDRSSLKRIDDILSCFEREHSSDTTSKGKVLIKDEFVRGRRF